MNFISLAAKNLLRRKGRTGLTIFGVAIAITVLLSLLSFSVGYERELNREMSNLGFHLLAVPKGCPYEATALIIHGGVIPKYLTNDDLSKIQQVPGVELAAPMLLQQVFKNGTPHIVYGIDLNSMKHLKPNWRVDGRFFSDSETQVMMVGGSLAEIENLKPGSILPFGTEQEPFTIVGVLKPTSSEDDNFHFIPLAEAQRIFGKKDKITAIAIRVSDTQSIPDLSKQLETIPDVQVVTTAQMTGTVMNLVGAARSLLFSVIAIAIVISAAGITNTLLMSANERIREFGMMKAIGASGRQIGLLLVTETLIITTAGGILGIMTSIAGSSLIESFMRGIIPYAPSGSIVGITPPLIGLCLSFSLGLGLVCSIYPALVSARLSPMEAIRENWL